MLSSDNPLGSLANILSPPAGDLKHLKTSWIVRQFFEP